MRRRTMSSRSAERMRKADDEAAPAAPKRVHPPLIEQFHVVVDRQLKSGYGTYEAAEKAARAIKTGHPQLQVSVYNAKEHRHTPIEPLQVGADPPRKLRHRTRGLHRRAVAGAAR